MENVFSILIVMEANQNQLQNLKCIKDPINNFDSGNYLKLKFAK